VAEEDKHRMEKVRRGDDTLMVGVEFSLTFLDMTLLQEAQYAGRHAVRGRDPRVVERVRGCIHGRGQNRQGTRIASLAAPSLPVADG